MLAAVPASTDRRKLAIGTLLLSFGLAACIPSAAQSPATPAFEVASIRKVAANHSLDELSRGIGLYSISPLPANKLVVRNTSLSNLICLAYAVDTGQIAGAPDWVSSQYFDLSAKAEGDTPLSLEQMRPLLKHLLEDRFQLQLHRSTRTVSGYALVIAPSGAKLHPAASGTPPRAQILPNGLQAWSAPMATLAAMLARPAGRPVTDKTGLAGIYNIKLDYAAPDDAQSNLPSVFAALKEQLGLKLEPQKLEQTTLVIDHADRNPPEN